MFLCQVPKNRKEGKIRNYERPLEQSVEVTLGYFFFERSEKAFEDVYVNDGVE